MTEPTPDQTTQDVPRYNTYVTEAYRGTGAFPIIPGPARVGDGVVTGVGNLLSLMTVVGEKTPANEVPPRQSHRKGWRSEVVGWLKDPEWHRAARQTAATVTMWAFTGTALTVFACGVKVAIEWSF